MARIPTSRTLSPDNFKDSPEWLAKLLVPNNTFFDAVYNAINGELTFVENIKAQTHSVNFITPSNYGCSNFTAYAFDNNLGKPVSAVWLMRITKVADIYASINNGVHIDWQEINGQIQINFVSGLEASTQYKLKVMVL